MSKLSAFRVIQQILLSPTDVVPATTLPPVDDMIEVVRGAREIFSNEKTIMSVSGDFEVVGDVHGDIESIITIFEKRGYPNYVKYVFLGDYCDRGTHSIHVVLLLFALKILFPQNIILIRGNHELSSVCKKYGFRDECVRMVGKKFYKAIIKAFGKLPLGAVLNGKVFCVHGGIPNTDMTLEELSDVERPLPSDYRDIQDSLLWSDPRKHVMFKEFEFNSARRVGEKFGEQALANFFENNELNYLIRGHEVCENGFDFPLGSEENCLTVFSAAGQKDGNLGATISVCLDDSISAMQFEKDLCSFFEIDSFKACIQKEISHFCHIVV